MTTLTTPGGMSVRLGDQAPEARRVEGRVGRRLQHDRVPGGERLGELVDRDLEREVPRHDRADDAHRLAPDLPRRQLTGELDERVAEVGLPRILVDQLGGIRQRVCQRGVELRPVRHHARAAGLEDQLLAERLLLGFQRRLQLLEAALAERAVGRPVGLVEGAARGVDRAVHVRLRRVRDLPQHLLGGRVDVGERAGLAVDELAVDQHPRLETDLGCVSHVARSLRVRDCLAPQRTMTREAHRQTDHVMEEPARQQAIGEQQHARVESHRVPGERSPLVESPGERRSETFGRVRQAHHGAAPAIDLA